MGLVDDLLVENTHKLGLAEPNDDFLTSFTSLLTLFWLAQDSKVQDSKPGNNTKTNNDYELIKCMYSRTVIIALHT